MSVPYYTTDPDPILTTESVEKILNDEPVLAENSAFERLILRLLNNDKALKLLTDTLQQVAEAAIPAEERGKANGVALLGVDGKLLQRVDYTKVDGSPASLPANGGAANTANTLAAARTIALSGAVTGTATSFNGGNNIVIPTTAMDVSKANAGVLSVARGGTGQTTAAGIRNSLGLGNTTGVLPVANGGTGASSLSAVTVGRASRADALQTARTIAVSGAVTGTATSFSGGNNIVIPTTALNVSKANAGVLSIARGGTGQTTAAAALSNLGAAPLNSPVFTGTISMGRKAGTAVGMGSVAIGCGVTASLDYSHAEGDGTTASGYRSHAEGYGTTASGTESHAEGYRTTASGNESHAEGNTTIADGTASHAAGINTIAHDYQYVIGTYNVGKAAPSVDNDRFIIGGGWVTRKNCFRVHSSGAVYGGNYSSSGADYAEMFEWLDGNPASEDRRGLFVTLEGDKLRIADAADDFILGVISATPSVVGDQYSDQWQGMFVRDAFGAAIWEEFVEPAYTDDQGIEHPEIKGRREKLSPDYNPQMDYLPREDRPEWTPVGLLGKLVALDDGTCIANGYCTVSNSGVATKAEGKTSFRVMKRLDDSHIQIFIL